MYIALNFQVLQTQLFNQALCIQECIYQSLSFTSLLMTRLSRSRSQPEHYCNTALHYIPTALKKDSGFVIPQQTPLQNIQNGACDIANQCNDFRR